MPRNPARVLSELARWFGGRVPASGVIDVGTSPSSRSERRSSGGSTRPSSGDRERRSSGGSTRPSSGSKKRKQVKKSVVFFFKFIYPFNIKGHHPKKKTHTL